MLAVYLHTRDDSPRAAHVRARLAEVLSDRGHTPAAEPAQAQLIASIGGDGTLLGAISRYHHLELPFLGVNAGNLGFLQEADENDLQRVVDQLAAGQYEAVAVPLLEARLHDTLVGYAFNEVVLERSGTRTLKIIMQVNGVEIGTLVGDGVMVASPAGSTAYSLAAGGAMMAPTVEALQLVTVNPHQSRLASPMPTPIILAPDSTVGFFLALDRPRSARLVLDGHAHPLPAGEGVTIRRSDRTVRLVRLGIHSFWEHVRQKFSTFAPPPKF